MLVTVVNNRGVERVPVGSEVEFTHKPRALDANYIECFFRGKYVGCVSSHPNSTKAGCLINSQVMAEIKKTTFKGIVKGEASIKLSENATEKLSLIVEIDDGKSIPQPPVNDVKFTVRIKGSMTENPEKKNVLKDFRNSQTVIVNLKVENDQIVAYYNSGRAGVVDDKNFQDISPYEEVLEVMGHLGSHNAKIINVTSTLFNAEFSVTEKQLKEAKQNDHKTILSVKKRIVDEGIATEETISEVEKYLKENGLERKHILEVFQTYKKYDADVSVRIPAKPETLFVDYFSGVKKSVIYLLRGKHLRFVGEKGTGKNNLITTLAWVFQRPLYELSLNSEFDKSDLLGSKTIKQEVDENGNEVMEVTFAKESFIEAMEVGGFLNLDEINTANPALLVQLHSTTDRRRTIQVSGYGKVVADMNFSIILTMNKDYQSTVPLNEATRDRFTPIVFPSNSSIANLLFNKYPDADQEHIKQCDKLYRGILELVQDGELSLDCMTIRGFEDAIEVADDLGLKEAVIDNIANRIDDDDYRAHVMNMIDLIIV